MYLVVSEESDEKNLITRYCASKQNTALNIDICLDKIKLKNPKKVNYRYWQSARPDTPYVSNQAGFYYFFVTNKYTPWFIKYGIAASRLIQ